MKKIIGFFLLLAIIAMPLVGRAQSDVDARIQQLEQDIADIKSDQAAGKSVVKSKFPVELYGFAAAQLFWGTAKTQLYTGINSAAAQSSVINRLAPGGGQNTWFSATPQNSCVGLLWTGSDVGKGLKLGGRIELDFVNILRNTSYGTSPIPRIRHLYMELMGKKWSLIAGQNWDIYSPLNTRSLSLGNNVWYQGNMGFRRPQVRLTYNIPFADVNNVQIAVSADHPQNTDDLYGAGADSGYPYGEALVQYSRKMSSGDLIVAASSVFGGNRNAGKTRKTYGFAGSLNVPFHKFALLTGEIQYGQNLGNMLTYAGTTGDARDLAGWAQISSRWIEQLETNLGYGIDNIQSSKIANANNAVTNSVVGIDRNQVFFGNIKFYPVKPFYIGLEYNYMRTNYKGSGPAAANIVFTNLVYAF